MRITPKDLFRLCLGHGQGIARRRVIDDGVHLVREVLVSSGGEAGQLLRQALITS